MVGPLETRDCESHFQGKMSVIAKTQGSTAQEDTTEAP